jgi:glutamyl-tRNA synthetase
MTRVRFCPSPTGAPHVGIARTALFNWAYARHTGGAFVFRIEDTDAARDSQESYEQLVDVLHWLGMDWDEGPEVGGPYLPYRQSERGELYRAAIEKLVAGRFLYESFSSAEEIEARHRAAGRDPKLGYDNFDRDLTAEQKDAFRAEGRAPVLRFRMPDEDITWIDLVRGEVTFSAGSVPDYVVARAGGQPLYPLVNPVDDALMRVTHVLRGEDLLSSTPRQIPLYRAMIEVGITDFVPEFGHLPYVMGDGNKKLSKRDPKANLLSYRDEGYLPEGLVNYLALLGWSIADDHDVFTPRELVEAFDIKNVKASPARFDPKKLLAMNAAHIRMLDADDFRMRLETYILAADLPADSEVLSAAAPLVQERVQTMVQAVDMVRFLLVPEPDFAIDESAATKQLDNSGQAVLAAAIPALEALSDWSDSAIEEALHQSLVEGMELKPRNAYGPVRVAITGSTVSPPLFESIRILGRERTLARLARARA